MNILLEKWQPKCLLIRTIRSLLNAIVKLSGFAFLVLPFIVFDESVLPIFQIVWPACALLNIDWFYNYKTDGKQKMLCMIASIYVALTLVYLHNYWQLIPLLIVICGSIFVAICEVTISMLVYGGIRFSLKQEVSMLTKEGKPIIVILGLYLSSIALFVMGHALSETMIFVFGVIVVILLTSSVLYIISNGFSIKKGWVSTFGFILDIVSLVAIIIYLIYLIPDENNLQNIVLTIMAAVIGGALTLGGVAWTIGRQDSNRKETMILENKPIWYPVLLNKDERKKSRPTDMFFFNKNLEGELFTIRTLQNTENAIIRISKIVVNQVEFFPLNINIVDKNKQIDLLFHAKNLNEDADFLIYTLDVLNNEYIFKVKLFEKKEEKEKNILFILAISELEKK